MRLLGRVQRFKPLYKILLSVLVGIISGKESLAGVGSQN
jgi:hypothetical protein